jgi:hypothetical protein
VQVWPELREAHDAICNQGITEQEMMAKFPGFDFSNCLDKWGYPQYTLKSAVARAEEVRRKLRNLVRTHQHIVLVTHRGLAAFLVQGPRFKNCGMFILIQIIRERIELTRVIERRSYRFATSDKLKERGYAINVNTLERQDFGPDLLLALKGKTTASLEIQQHLTVNFETNTPN